MKTVPLFHEQETEQLGEKLAQVSDGVCVIYLQGALGAGKTTFVRGFLKGKGYGQLVKSPTYTLLETYELKGVTIHHIDLYRLKKPQELEYLGLRDQEGQAIFLIEWPEQGEGYLPPPDIVCRFEMLPAGRRVAIDFCSAKSAEISNKWQ